MTSRQRSPRRRYRKAADRRVWVFSELNHELTPETMAKVLTSAALEQARLENDAQQQQQQQRDDPAERPTLSFEERGEEAGS